MNTDPALNSQSGGMQSYGYLPQTGSQLAKMEAQNPSFAFSEDPDRNDEEEEDYDDDEDDDDSVGSSGKAVVKKKAEKAKWTLEEVGLKFY